MRGIAVVSGIMGLIATYTVGLNLIVTKKEYDILFDSNLNRAVVGSDEIKIVFFSDLHMKQYGRKNCRLLKKIKKEKPNYIFIGGDLITTYPAAYRGVRNQYQWLEDLKYFLMDLAEIAPTYYVDGNHEENLMTALDGMYFDIYTKYIEAIKVSRVRILNNKHVELLEGVELYGFLQPMELYAKRKLVPLNFETLKETLGTADRTKFNILLTHDPKYAKVYSSWGADLILCGHVHGGVIRFGQHGLLSPSYTIFPKYCYGKYSVGKSMLIVSSGLNMHSIPIRWFNPAEYVVVNIQESTLHNVKYK